MQSPEPRFSRIAAVIADPTRARMLASLLGGEYRSAGELAKAAGVTPQAASTQLAQLLDNGLVALRQQGRHKYFALADADVAHALEALSMVAERDNVSARWDRPAYRPLKCARRCYGHMAGELGVAQFDMLIRKQYLRPSDQGLQLTDIGLVWTKQVGLELPKKSASQFAYPCMDWSERKDHLAGSLAKALLELYVAKNWLRAPKETRALELTHLGQQVLVPLLKRP
jgi:DNA-binding transcriptional ArsR family regulator